jgi:RNA polymerase sigma-70 factor (ECF subfamily)
MTSTTVTAAWVTSVGTQTNQAADLAQAFARCGRSLYRYLAVRVGADSHLADDLMQQVWMRAVQGSFSGPNTEIEYWLKAVARNVVREHWRRQKTVPPHVPIGDPALAAELAERIRSEELPEAVWERREVRDQLLLAVTELADVEQELIVAHYFQGKPQSSLAARLGISERAVEGRLYRARRALREKLRDLETWECHP